MPLTTVTDLSLSGSRNGAFAAERKRTWAASYAVCAAARRAASVASPAAATTGAAALALRSNTGSAGTNGTDWPSAEVRLVPPPPPDWLVGSWAGAHWHRRSTSPLLSSPPLAHWPWP